MGETRVDLMHVLEDLRDAYPCDLEETLLVEIVANALDSGATRIEVANAPAQASFVVVDNGAGMLRQHLRRFHDLAASTKSRGQGIGFAGVGIKLGLLASKEVVTESRRGPQHIATSWQLVGRHRAAWKWVPPPGRVQGHGTAVAFALSNTLSPLYDPAFVETTVRRHFRPLFDPDLREFLSAHYPQGISFVVHGRLLGPDTELAPERGELAIKPPRHRKPTAFGYLTRSTEPLPEERQGVAVSTLGKVIRGGWDWLSLSPSDRERIGGLIEVPALAEALTLNKADFIRGGARGATYLSFRKAIQEAVAQQLRIWGENPAPQTQPTRRATRPLERDLEQVLLRLAGDFPLLASLVPQSKERQARLALRPRRDGAAVGLGSDGSGSDGTVPNGGVPDGSSPAPDAPASPGTDAAPSSPATGTVADPGQPSPSTTPDAPSVSPEAGGDKSPAVSVRTGPRAPHYGFGVRFEERTDSAELGRLADDALYVNTAHPAYVRAAASHSEAYHVALTTAVVLAPLAASPAEERGFITAFLSHWGESGDKKHAR